MSKTFNLHIKKVSSDAPYHVSMEISRSVLVEHPSVLHKALKDLHEVALLSIPKGEEVFVQLELEPGIKNTTACKREDMWDIINQLVYEVA